MNGAKLKCLREYRNFSQEYIADKLGITQNSYSRIENNQTKITADRLQALSDILNFPVTELLSDNEPVIHFPTAMGNSLDKTDPQEKTSHLYEQIIAGKDDKIKFLENEITQLHDEKKKLVQLIDKLTNAGVYKEDDFIGSIKGFRAG